MGLFDAIKSLGSATIGTALLPVDVALDVVDVTFAVNRESATMDRLDKIRGHLADAIDTADD